MAIYLNTPKERALSSPHYRLSSEMHNSNSTNGPFFGACESDDEGDDTTYIVKPERDQHEDRTIHSCARRFNGERVRCRCTTVARSPRGLSTSFEKRFSGEGSNIPKLQANDEIGSHVGVSIQTVLNKVAVGSIVRHSERYDIASDCVRVHVDLCVGTSVSSLRDQLVEQLGVANVTISIGECGLHVISVFGSAALWKQFVRRQSSILATDASVISSVWWFLDYLKGVSSLWSTPEGRGLLKVCVFGFLLGTILLAILLSIEDAIALQRAYQVRSQQLHTHLPQDQYGRSSDRPELFFVFAATCHTLKTWLSPWEPTRVAS